MTSGGSKPEATFTGTVRLRQADVILEQAGTTYEASVQARGMFIR